MSSAGRHSGRRPLFPAEATRRRAHRTPEEMTRRAWRLVGLHLLVPGSAQLVAGSRVLGRIAVTLWAVCLGAVAAALLTWLVAPRIALGLVTGAAGLTALQVAAVAVAVAWLALTIDTLRLVRLRRLRLWARPVAAAGLALTALAGAGAGAYGAYLAGTARSAIVTVFPRTEARAGAVATQAPAAGRTDILLVGMDRPVRGGSLRPESISLASIDGATGHVTLIALPTTLRRVPFPASSPMHRLYPHGYVTCIAAPCTLADVYLEGQAVGSALYPDADGLSPGMAALRDAVDGATGRTVDYSVQVSTDGIGRLVDALGGVRIGGSRLNGAATVRYLRSTAQSDGVSGADRTLQVETALLQQADPANLLLQFGAIAKASSAAIDTDVPQDVVTDLAVVALKAQGQSVTRLRLAPPLIADLKDPDWTAVHRLVAAAVR